MCREYGARLLVDEAHALGVIGPEGSGTAPATGIVPDLVMSTFSKSLASCGGFVAGSKALIDYLRIASRPLLFTAAGTPAAMAAARCAAGIARDEDWRREAVRARATQLRDGLRQLGYQVSESDGSAIVAVHVGDMWEAGTLWRSLLEEGVYTNCAIPPAVPKAVLRTSVMATHSEEHIDRALAGFEAVLTRVTGSTGAPGPSSRGRHGGDRQGGVGDPGRASSRRGRHPDPRSHPGRRRGGPGFGAVLLAEPGPRG